MPGKPFPHPFGRARLDLKQGVRQGDSGRKLDEHVDVVLHPADLVYEYFLLMADPCEICPRSRLFFFGNQFESVFCAENNVDEILNKRVSQWTYLWTEYSTEVVNSCVAPEGALTFFNPYPRLRRGLTCYRALKALP